MCSKQVIRQRRERDLQTGQYTADQIYELLLQGLLGGPAAKILLPVQGAWVQSLVRELDPHAATKRTCRPQGKIQDAVSCN